MPEDGDTTREAQDTPVVHGNANHNESETSELAKSRKANKTPKGHNKETSNQTPLVSSQTADEIVTTVSSSGKANIF